MSATRLPKAHSAGAAPSASNGHASSGPPAPIKADAHARFGHSLSQIAVTSGDAAPIQRQPEKNSCTIGEDDDLSAPAPSPLQSLFGGMVSPEAINAAMTSSQMPQPSQAQPTEQQKIQADLQNQIFNITQDVTVNKARTADKAYEKMDEYIRQ